MSQMGVKAGEKCTLEYFVGNKNEPKRSLITCLNFAAVAHKDQKRKDVEKTPYINHPIGVAYIISEEAELPNLDLLRGCLLHDTVEDTDVVIEDIFAKFGEYIGNLVREVTDDKTLPKQTRKNHQITHAQTSSPQAKMVKLADKLYNLRDLDRSLPDGWSEERRKEYFEWSFKVCDGLRGVCPKIEAKLDDLFASKGLIVHKKSERETIVIPHWPKHDELKTLIAAADFAARYHRCHFVFNAKNGEPYINHLVSLALIVSEEAQIEDSTVLCAAFLCDVVGKGSATLDEIVATFGTEVGKLVSELTYDHSQTLKDQFQTKIRHTTTMSDAAKVITLAYVFDNCRRLESFEPEGWPLALRDQYILWAGELIDLLIGSHFVLERKLDSICVAKMFGNLKCNSMNKHEAKDES